MTTKPDPPRDRGPRPSSASLLLDRLIDDGRTLSHDERIEQLVQAALRDGPGRLRFEDELARGGMGAVRQAFDATLQRRMAVKTMHAKTYDHVMLVHGFLREAQVTGQLDHPNIVPIHELGRDDRGELYFTMKLVEGESLKARIGGQPPRTHEALVCQLEIFIKVCDALAFAHSRGVLHCDIKSANVMVGKYGQVYLMDWGGAQLVGPRPGDDASQWVRDSLPPLPPAETEGMVFGTPSYMSPEQASAGREPMDERSDVFSMGALLYEMMTGRPPYHGGTPLEGIMRAQMVDVEPPAPLPAVYPQELIRIVMTALARRPSDRYQSVEELQAAIAGLLRGGGDFPTIRYKKGTHVIREGEVGDAAYWIESGTLEVYKEKDGHRRSLRLLQPGAMFGETAIFARSARTASVVALDDVTLKLITADVLERELASMTPWMRAAITTLARRFSEEEEELRGRSAVQVVPPTAVAPQDAPCSAATLTGPILGAPDTDGTASGRLAPAGESVMIDLEDLSSGGSGLSEAFAADDLAIETDVDVADDPVVDADVDVEPGDGEENVDTRLIGPWTKKPPPRRS